MMYDIHSFSIYNLASNICRYVRFEVFMVVKIKFEVLWVVMLCSICGKIPTDLRFSQQ